jgi:hypothetical protein
MNQMAFSSPQALAKYVADNSIAQTKIVQIWERKGQWYLFWYS